VALTEKLQTDRALRRSTTPSESTGVVTLIAA
jgi:hypothetical protein